MSHLSAQEIFEELIKRKKLQIELEGFTFPQAELETIALRGNLNVIKSRATNLYRDAGLDWNNFIIRCVVMPISADKEYPTISVFSEDPQPIKRYKVTIIG